MQGGGRSKGNLSSLLKAKRSRRGPFDQKSKCLTVRHLICSWCAMSSRILRCVTGRARAFFYAAGRIRLACPPPAAQPFEPAGSRCFPAPFSGWHWRLESNSPEAPVAGRAGVNLHDDVAAFDFEWLLGTGRDFRFHARKCP